jgi:hypothetical protein
VQGKSNINKKTQLYQRMTDISECEGETRGDINEVVARIGNLWTITASLSSVSILPFWRVIGTTDTNLKKFSSA